MDINHFLGIPSLAFNLMLKSSKLRLALISDPEMSDFFRKSIRGGMSFIAKRKVKSDYIDSNPKNCERRMTHIRYIDGNNLYGSQMLFDLPVKDYKFEDSIFIEKIEKILKKNPLFVKREECFWRLTWTTQSSFTHFTRTSL